MDNPIRIGDYDVYSPSRLGLSDRAEFPQGYPRWRGYASAPSVDQGSAPCRTCEPCRLENQEVRGVETTVSTFFTSRAARRDHSDEEPITCPVTGDP